MMKAPIDPGNGGSSHGHLLKVVVALAVQLAAGTEAFAAAQGAGMEPGEGDRPVMQAAATKAAHADGLVAARTDASISAGAVTKAGAVLNRRAADGSTAADAAIGRDVEAALRADAATDSYQVTATVIGGVVTLQGKVNSWQQKQLAAAVAQEVKGVRGVRNDIAFGGDSNRDSREIQVDVTRALRRDVWVDDERIEVVAEGGVVTLKGQVGSRLAQSRACAAAYVGGVQAVDVSGLAVDASIGAPEKKKRESLTDRWGGEIQRSVQAALQSDARAGEFDLAVSVWNGVVTLTGAVDNLKAKRAAERVAQDVFGVWRVNNYIEARVHRAESDAELAARVTAALQRDASVGTRDIRVSARNCVVYLNGQVETELESSHAEDLTSRINGVAQIKNYLYCAEPARG